MNFIDLHYFVITAERLNISRAAEMLHLSQPSLSEAISHLESSVGRPLFTRVKNHLTLTTEGKQFYEKAARVLKAKQKLDEDMQSITEGLAGRIRLGISSTYSGILLPPVLSDFRSLYPEVEINVTTQTSAILETLLTDKVLDLAVIVSDRAADGITTKLLFYEEILLAVPPNDPIINLAIPGNNNDYPFMPVEALRGRSFILSPKSMRLRDSAAVFFRSEGIEYQTTIETASIETANRLAALGAGIAFLPASFVEVIDTPPMPRYFRTSKSLADWKVCIALRNDRQHDPLIQHFIKVFEEKI
jgi:LysR family hydrogen peroxide-inducible transcriptional activator